MHTHALKRAAAMLSAATLLLVGLVVAAVPAQAADPTDLFLSEYIEGSSNNKALEIYNGTGAAVDLAAGQYSVQMFFNGSPTAGLSVNLDGTVASGDVFVLAHASANDAILAAADQTNGAGWFNGDDAVVLRKGTANLDVIGQIGFDPGTEWGTGATSTADNTLRRMPEVCAGDPDGANAFNPAAEWAGFATDVVDGLGSHTATCSTEPPVDDAPAVVSVNPSDGGLGFADSNVVVTFSEPVNATTASFTLDCSVSGAVAFGLSGSLTAFTLDPAADLEIGEECTLTVLALEVSDADTIDPPDTMAADFSSSFTVADACTAPPTPIPAIQGSGAAAAITGPVTTKGVVVGDYEGPAPTLRGFYLQDPVGDGDPETSDGIFVFNANNDSVALGDLVVVSGTAAEFQDQTQVSASQVTECDTGLTVAATEVSLPVPSATHLERYEGMLVTMPQTLFVTEHFQLGRFGQVVVSTGDRLRQPTNVVGPGAPALTLQAANDLNRIIIDDDLNNQNPDPILFGRGGLPLSASNTLRGGDTITGATGVMSYTWAGNAASGNAYRLRPVNALGGDVVFEAANPRPPQPTEVGGDVTAASLNLLNYFNTFTGCTNGVAGGPTDCRGAENAVEFERQATKTVAAILKIDADVIGVNEIENDGYGPASAIADLVDRLNAETAPGTYAFIDVDAGTAQVDAMGTDAIKVGMLYQPAAVTPVGRTAALNTTSFVTGGDGAPRSRPSLAQAFEVNATGGVFVADVNHLKSKGSACDVPDAGDGQGNCNEVRLNSARELAEWLAADPTETGEQDILIMGDLNSYAKEDPITALEGAGYTNLIEHFLGPDAYSYVFDGQWGYLDHALGSTDLFGRGQVTGVAEYHINADEPAVLDFNTNFKTAGQIVSLFAPDEFRVSDHDPVIVGLAPNSPAQVEAGFGAGFLRCGPDNAALSVEITDRDADDTHTVTVDWGDGTEATIVGTDEDSVTLAHTYAEVGTYTATVTVLDSHGHLTETTAETTVAYDTDGITPPFKNGSVTAKIGSTVPVKVTFSDCDGSKPTDLHPTVTAALDGQVVLTGTMTRTGGQWQYLLRTGNLAGPGTYALTITVPETGQTVTGTVVVRR